MALFHQLNALWHEIEAETHRAWGAFEHGPSREATISFHEHKANADRLRAGACALQRQMAAETATEAIQAAASYTPDGGYSKSDLAGVI